MTAASVLPVPLRGLKVHQSEKMTKTVTTCILLHKEVLFLNFYVKTIMPFMAFNLLFQNSCLLGVIMNLKPCPQNKILVPFRGVLKNFRPTLQSFSEGSTPPGF